MRVDACADTCLGSCAVMRADMRVEMCADVRLDPCVDMCVDMYVDICADRSADMCVDMRHLECAKEHANEAKPVVI